MRVYNVLNATAFGDKGIPLQNWVMIDLGLLPSAFLLITLPPERAAAALDDATRSEAERRRIGSVLPAVLAAAGELNYEGPIPVAGYCAAPTPVPGAGSAGRCARRSRASARPPRDWRWRSTAPGPSRASPSSRTRAARTPQVRAAWRCSAAVLDLHPVPHTLVYRTEVYAAEDAQTPDVWIDAGTRRPAGDAAKIDAGSTGSSYCPPAWSTAGSRFWSEVPSPTHPALRSRLLRRAGHLLRPGRARRPRRARDHGRSTREASTPPSCRTSQRGRSALGARSTSSSRARARLFEQFVSYILKANYLRNGVYPSCVGVERMLQAEEVTRVALERGADAIAHGSTGPATTMSASTR